MSEPDRLKGPYVEMIEAQTRAYWNHLTTEYFERTGIRVPLLTEEDVRAFALSRTLPDGANAWLVYSLAVAGNIRSDIPAPEFRQLFAIVQAGNAALQLKPQPIEILTAIEALRSAPRRPGPPPTGIDMARVRRALVEWPSAWPPTQPAFANLSLGGLTDRRLRQILHAARTSWQAELRVAEQQRASST
jgi:hypothetical protein